MDGYDNEELTEAELEDIRRERAAARRRKLAARERRRKKRRQQAIIRCSILLVAVILVIFIIVKLITGIVGLFTKDKKKATTTEAPTTQQVTTEAPVAEIDENILAKDMPADRATALATLQTLATTDTDIKSIVDNEAVYPDVVIRNLAANTELKQFTLDYVAKINTVYDGNFTVDANQTEVPLFLQYDEEWGYADYGNDLVAYSGSAPTCLSMAYTYLKQDGSMNPVKVADYSTEHGYVDEQGATNWTLMTDGAAGLGLSAETLNVNEDDMKAALEADKVIICAMAPGDFTRSSSYIVIKDYKDGLFYINDPTSQARSDVGWDFKRLSDQITNMWAFSVGTGDTTAVDSSNSTDSTDATVSANSTGTSDTTTSNGGSTDNTTTTNNTAGSDSTNTNTTSNTTTGNDDPQSAN